ncbi:TPA: single-stranded-DNA-specific exonuclease RecJ [bacterium]|nr:single-stranded-DNA-specific exonuclease RecJ [bacterium]
MQKIWRIKKPDLNLSRELALQLEIPLLIAKLLVNRGITDKESGYAFLHPNISQLHSPNKMPNVDKAVQRIRQAIANNEKIWIYGDYDVDGVSSVCLLASCLKELNANFDYHIPSRFDEGYGLNKESLVELKNKGCQLLITVDCGISTVKEVIFANESGIDVIITDHHNPHEKIPPAIAVVNPKLKGSVYPYESLAGVGVVLKLAQSLIEAHGFLSEEFIMNNLDLVALGTIADIVPLTGENRVIASLGLKELNKLKRPGIKALCDVSRLKQGNIDSSSVGFRIGPRLNAAGRMDSAINAVKLLLSESYEEAFEIAQKLDTANSDRQNIERKITNEARGQAQKLDLAHLKALVLAGENWHSGAIGISASKLQEQFYRPTILISIEGDWGRGSARSIPSFDIHEAIAKCSNLLERYGGHKGAAGLTIAKENIDKFRKEFQQIAYETITEDDLKSIVDIDAEMSLSDLTMDAVKSLSLLEPYGLDNPEPLIIINNLLVKGLPRVVGKNNNHIQITVSDCQNEMRTIAFNMGKLEREISQKNVRLDLVCKPYIDDYNELIDVKLDIKEIKIHSGDSSEATVASAEIFEQNQLKIVDHRNFPNKIKYVKKLINTREKSLMYVRDDLAVNQLHKLIGTSDLADKLGLCYSEISKEESDDIKSRFIDGELKAIISSIPIEEPLIGLKHLVFCHPIPTKDIFINSCSPAIESSEEVFIHLLFNNNDMDMLTSILKHQYPDRQLLTNVYRKIRDLYKDKPVPLEEILSGMVLDDPKDMIISRCIDIFEELSLVKREQDNGFVSLSILPEPEKRRNLNESKIYSVGERIKSEWTEFSQFINKKTAEDIRKMIIEHF